MPWRTFRGTGLFTKLLEADGSTQQVTRTGDMLTGRAGFVISDSGGTSRVSDSKGQLHQLMRNGSVTTDLSTGATSFEIWSTAVTIDRMSAPSSCPVCGAEALRRIAYGFPSADLFDDPDVVLGGCVVSSDSPTWRCRNVACGHEFGTSQGS